MTALFSPGGRAALARLVDAGALFGFDFDGTLAPIRPTPAEVAMDARTGAAFARLTQCLPVAVISGRGAADVRARLHGAPRWVLGNHGAEGMPAADATRLAAQAAVCAAWRAQLGGPAAGAAISGIVMEDKRYTLSLHYRQAPDHDVARMRLAALASVLRPAPLVEHGKCVLNLLPAGSPDKFAALQALARAHAPEAPVFFIGDDENDEKVFRRAPPDWITVKVGGGASAARYRVPDQEAVAGCLELLLDLAASRRGRSVLRGPVQHP